MNKQNMLRPVATAFVAAMTFGAFGSPASAIDEIPVVTMDTGQSVKALVYARAFELSEPYTYAWTADQAEITSGHLLVFEVDPAMAQPRQVESPVLYLGRTPAEILNVGVESGNMIVLVPGDVDVAASVAYFGSWELPERVDDARGAAEEAAALALGVSPIGAAQFTAALAAGGDALRTRSVNGVHRAVADLLDVYSPEERELAEAYRLIPAE